jgi:hypothetical protein
VEKESLGTAPTACAQCGEPIPPEETAVAVIRADGTPGLVHPACYRAFIAAGGETTARHRPPPRADEPRP